MACDCTTEINAAVAALEANFNTNWGVLHDYLHDTFGEVGSWTVGLGNDIVQDHVATLALFNAIITADPNLTEAIRQLTDSGGGTIRNAVGTALNILYDITGSYLSTAPEFDHPASILKAIYAAVYRTFPVPEE